MSSILVTHASRYGGTQGIAERIAVTLTACGHQAEAWPIGGPRDLAAYDAFVIGSGVYMGSWLKEARDFVRHHREILATRPVWLFSSGPLGSAKLDAKGRDPLTAAKPKEVAEFSESLRPRTAARRPGRWSFSTTPISRAPSRITTSRPTACPFRRCS